jgi:peptidyl-Lys metalloendopeptidase
MFKQKRVVFALFLSVLLIALVATAVGAAPSRQADVKLSLAQSSFDASQPVTLDVTISNPGKSSIRVLKWFTPAEDVEEALFKVTRDGETVAYTGAIYKRPAPAAADYVTLKPGASLTRSVDLSAYYDFSVSGNYSVSYNVSAWNLYSEKASGLFSASMASDKVDFYAEGRAAKVPGEISPLAVTGSTTYNKCTTTQQSDALAARNQASTYSADALSYLNSGKTGSRYTTWFGIVTTTRYNTVKSHFSAISNAMDTAPVKFDCSCRKKYYAYVYPNQPYTIYLCSVFWTAPMTGTDSKAGTLIHEMSHFTVVAGTDDFVYGQTNAKSLAISNPDNAVRNADNHEYFAENTPTLP